MIFMRIVLTTCILVASFATVSVKAMMGPYLATFAGDLCLGATYIGVTAQNIAPRSKNMLERNGFTAAMISQLNIDARKIAPYVPVLLPFGAILAIGGRVSMLSSFWGLLLAVSSVPINTILMASSYRIRLKQAPDAGLAAQLEDISSDVVNWFMEEKS